MVISLINMKRSNNFAAKYKKYQKLKNEYNEK